MADHIADISLTTFSNAFFGPKGPINNISVLLQMIVGVDQATSHNLNQWRQDYRHIYATLVLNEINMQVSVIDRKFNVELVPHYYQIYIRWYATHERLIRYKNKSTKLMIEDGWIKGKETWLQKRDEKNATRITPSSWTGYKKHNPLSLRV